ncbi:MAG TPA: zf-HC2 domain-containing protein [Pyrinomonadaceae bacterium]|nr:zf-HC2 domain-containing protein [Pyrinomonadaceae bacterium]
MATTEYICSTEKIAAFIEGDLETGDRLALETHIAQCARCTSELQAQQLFMCELESALANAEDVSVPRNFAKVVAVRAESDMSGLRNASEHKKALRLCLILALAAFALLGVTATKSVLVDAQSIVNKGFAFFGLMGKAAYDALVGFGVVLRVLSSGFISDSRFAGLTALLFVALAIGLLTLLISRYHRTRLSE